MTYKNKTHLKALCIRSLCVASSPLLLFFQHLLHHSSFPLPLLPIFFTYSNFWSIFSFYVLAFCFDFFVLFCFHLAENE